MINRASKLGIFICLMTLAACQTKEEPDTILSTSINTSKKPTTVIASLAKRAQTCWFKSGDKAFKPYRLANEVTSFAGKPRFLLVPRKNPGGLPLLVVQAESKKGSGSSGRFTNIQTFGPLLQSPDGRRILGDVNRWSKGETSCT